LPLPGAGSNGTHFRGIAGTPEGAAQGGFAAAEQLMKSRVFRTLKPLKIQNKIHLISQFLQLIGALFQRLSLNARLLPIHCSVTWSTRRSDFWADRD
jgi:hypothetical protein